MVGLQFQCKQTQQLGFAIHLFGLIHPSIPSTWLSTWPTGDAQLTSVQGLHECMFLSPFPVKLLPLVLPGNGCVGADTGLGLGRKGGSRRTCLAHGRVLKGGCGCVGFGWRGLWSIPVVPHYFGVMDAFECLKNALSLSPGEKKCPL